MAGLPPPLRQRRVFVDSSAYLALLDADDPDHGQAVELLRRLAQQRYRLYTSNIILIEAHALVLSTLGIAAAGRFLRDIAESRTVVVRVRASDEERAKQIVFQYEDKDFSFADATSFVLIERVRIPYAFTFDRHFTQYGLTVLPGG